MTGPPTVVGVTGSQREGSHTATAVETLLDRARTAGARTDHVDAGAVDLPMFDPGAPDAGDAPAVRRRIRAADAVVLATPMYHGSVASPLKTVLDYCGAEEFEDTVVGLLVVAGGGFPTPALDHLTAICRSFDAWVLPHQVAIPNSRSAFEDGALADPDLRDRVETLATRLVDYAGVGAYPDRAGARTEAVGD